VGVDMSEKDMEHINQKNLIELHDLGDEYFWLQFEIKCWSCGATNHPGLEMRPSKVEDFKTKT